MAVNDPTAAGNPVELTEAGCRLLLERSYSGELGGVRRSLLGSGAISPGRGNIVGARPAGEFAVVGRGGANDLRLTTGVVGWALQTLPGMLGHALQCLSPVRTGSYVGLLQLLVVE